MRSSSSDGTLISSGQRQWIPWVITESRQADRLACLSTLSCAGCSYRSVLIGKFSKHVAVVAGVGCAPAPKNLASKIVQLREQVRLGEEPGSLPFKHFFTVVSFLELERMDCRAASEEKRPVLWRRFVRA
jgi:hypothetical protein